MVCFLGFFDSGTQSAIPGTPQIAITTPIQLFRGVPYNIEATNFFYRLNLHLSGIQAARNCSRIGLKQIIQSIQGSLRPLPLTKAIKQALASLLLLSSCSIRSRLLPAASLACSLRCRILQGCDRRHYSLFYINVFKINIILHYFRNFYILNLCFQC